MSKKQKNTTKKMPSQPVKMIILDEHPFWLQPLYEELEDRGVKFTKVDISADFYNPLDLPEKALYVNRLSPSSLKRDNASALMYTFNYLTHLEKFGARVVNGSHTVLLETSKAAQASLLRQLKISTPKSLVVNDVQLLPTAAQLLSFPVLVKPNCGGSGMNIQRFDSLGELEEAVNSGQVLLPPEKVLIIQEYIAPGDGYIVRVEIIGGKVVYAMKVYSGSTFNLCPSEKCDIERGPTLASSQTDLGYCVATPTSDVRFEYYPELPEEIRTSLERLVKVAGLELAGIEYVVDAAGQWYVYDINALSILRGTFKQEYGIDGWGMLADYLVEQGSNL